MNESKEQEFLAGERARLNVLEPVKTEKKEKRTIRRVPPDDSSNH